MGFADGIKLRDFRALWKTERVENGARFTIWAYAREGRVDYRVSVKEPSTLSGYGVVISTDASVDSGTIEMTAVTNGTLRIIGASDTTVGEMVMPEGAGTCCGRDKVWLYFKMRVCRSTKNGGTGCKDSRGGHPLHLRCTKVVTPRGSNKAVPSSTPSAMATTSPSTSLNAGLTCASGFSDRKHLLCRRVLWEVVQVSNGAQFTVWAYARFGKIDYEVTMMGPGTLKKYGVLITTDAAVDKRTIVMDEVSDGTRKVRGSSRMAVADMMIPEGRVTCCGVGKVRVYFRVRACRWAGQGGTGCKNAVGRRAAFLKCGDICTGSNGGLPMSGSQECPTCVR